MHFVEGRSVHVPVEHKPRASQVLKRAREILAEAKAQGKIGKILPLKPKQIKPVDDQQ